MGEIAPQAPSAYALERVVSTFQKLATRLINDPDLIADEDVLATALAVENDADAVLNGLIRAAVWADRRVDEAEAERKAWIARRDRYDARLEAIRATIVDAMQALGRTRHRGIERLASISEPKAPKLQVDVDKLPAEYVQETTRTVIDRLPRLDLIREDLAQGVVIEGASVGNNPPVLRLTR